MPSFSLVIVGSGGGPDETNLSAYLFKPFDSAWEDGILALEAGSGQGALTQLLRQSPQLFESSGSARPKPISSAEIYSFVTAFLITHAHLDHINSLVISAGSLKGPRKRVYASKQVLEDLETVFSDRIWPNLASWDESDDEFKLLYSTLQQNHYEVVHSSVSVCCMPLSHGHNGSGPGCYESSAFFIRHESSSCEFLFFGDVEPDKVSSRPRTLHVWQAAAPKIPHKLSTIFIECSWPCGRKDDMLYGHLNPEHLVDELCALAIEVVNHRRGQSTSTTRTRPLRKRQKKNPITPEDLLGTLHGLRIYIIHCKEGPNACPDKPMRHVIAEQVSTLVAKHGLGARVLVAEPGMSIDI